MNNEKIKKELPEGWKWVKLEEVCRKVDTVKRKEKIPEDELLYLDIGGIDNLVNKIFSHKKYKWKDAPSRAQQIISKDDILFSTVRTYMKNIAVVDNTIYEGQIASSGFCVIRGDKNMMDPKYVFYYTVSQEFLRPLNELQTGSSYPAVRDKDVFNQFFPLPPKPIQQAIVSKIEELFSELDKGIENLLNAQQQLKTYRQSVLKWAFEGRLTNENVKEGELPEGWKVAKLKDLTVEKVGLRRGPFGSAIKKEFFVPNGYKIYEQGNAINNDPYRGKYFITEEKYNELKNFSVEPNDLIVSCSGVTLGRICEIPEDAKPGVINQALLRIRLKKDMVLNRYFIIHFRGAFFQKKIFDQSQGTAMPNLVGIKDFKEIEMFIPTIQEQNKIIEAIESSLSVADKMQESITQSLQQSEALKQSILKMAFEGRLV
jgi:type I restriction enzyme S subunit